MTQVDKLRAEGYTGKGIKIAVIDTGVSLDLSARTIGIIGLTKNRRLD
jgi:hypothetical protein